MDNPMQTMKDMEAFMVALRARAQRLHDELAEVEQDIEAGNRFLSAAGDAYAVNTSAGIGPTDLGGCTTIHEAMRRYASLNGNTLTVTEAAKVIQQAGISKGSSTRASIYRLIERHKSEWIRLTRGRYAHVDGAGPAPTTHE